MHWKDSVKQFLFFVLYYSGLEFLLARRIRADAAVILMYHGVCDRSKLPAHIDFHFSPSIFERHMRILRRRYEVIPATELLARLRTGKPLGRSIVLTFDDGYRNNLTHAAPILARFGFSYSIYLATRYVDTGEWAPLNQLYALWAEGKIATSEVERIREIIRRRTRAEAADVLRDLAERTRQASLPDDDSFAMMNWQQARELLAQGAEIGGHTHTHCCTAVESPETCREELLHSRDLIESNLGNHVTLFAYPYGKKPYIDPERGSSLVRDCGYECAITTEYGAVVRSSNAFRLPRLGAQRPAYRFACDLAYLFLKSRLREKKV